MSITRIRAAQSAIAVAALLISAAMNTASAQNRRDQHVINGGRVAIIAPAPTAVVVVPARHGYYNPYYSPGYSPYGYFPNAAFVQNIPVVMLQDGRVFANFGYGFEQVVRSCQPGGFATVVGGYGGGVITNGSAIVQPTAVQPVVTQPAPAQPTASEQMLTRAISPASVVTAVPGPLAVQVITPSCWSNYGSSVFVFRR
jgi:hypothetical protein